MTVPEDSNAMTHKGQRVFCDAWLTKPVIFLLVKWFILGIATKLVTLYTDDRLMASPNESRETLQNTQSVTPGHKVQHRGEAWLWRRKEIEIWEYALLALEWAKGVGGGTMYRTLPKKNTVTLPLPIPYVLKYKNITNSTRHNSKIFKTKVVILFYHHKR